MEAGRTGERGEVRLVTVDGGRVLRGRAEYTRVTRLALRVSGGPCAALTYISRTSALNLPVLNSVTIALPEPPLTVKPPMLAVGLSSTGRSLYTLNLTWSEVSQYDSIFSGQNCKSNGILPKMSGHVTWSLTRCEAKTSPSLDTVVRPYR